MVRTFFAVAALAGLGTAGSAAPDRAAKDREGMAALEAKVPGAPAGARSVSEGGGPVRLRPRSRFGLRPRRPPTTLVQTERHARISPRPPRILSNGRRFRAAAVTFPLAAVPRPGCGAHERHVVR